MLMGLMLGSCPTNYHSKEFMSVVALHHDKTVFLRPLCILALTIFVPLPTGIFNIFMFYIQQPLSLIILTTTVDSNTFKA